MNDSTATSDLKLKRLNAALEHTGAVRGVRNKHVAEATGYTEGSVRGILSGNAALSDRFIKAVCSKFGISLEWVEEGKEPVFDWKPNSSGNGRIYRLPKIAGADLRGGKAPAIAQPIAGLSYPYKIAGPEASVPRIAGPAIAGVCSPYTTIRELSEALQEYFSNLNEDAEYGLYVGLALLEISAFPKHELIDLAFQLRKLTDGDSDKLATAAADERFERSGIKPSTRLKLERIPVEPEEENQEK